MPIYDIYRKVVSQMKITMTLLMLLVLLLPDAFAQDYTHLRVPLPALAVYLRVPLPALEKAR